VRHGIPADRFEAGVGLQFRICNGNLVQEFSIQIEVERCGSRCVLPWHESHLDCDGRRLDGRSPVLPFRTCGQLPQRRRGLGAVLAQGLPRGADKCSNWVRTKLRLGGGCCPLQTHPGLQVVWIESGVLTLNVVSGGSVPVTRDQGAAPATTELVGPGQSTELRPGDSLVEIEGIVHYAQNLGDGPVVFLAAALLEQDEPPSITVTPTPTSTSTPVS